MNLRDKFYLEIRVHPPLLVVWSVNAMLVLKEMINKLN